MKSALLLAAFISLGPTVSFAVPSEIRICHLSESASKVLPIKMDEDHRLAGFEIAIHEFIKTTRTPAKLISAPSGISIPEGIKWAKNQDCTVLVGLVTSRDALIAAKLLKANDLLAFTSTANADEINSGFPNLLSAAVSQSDWVDQAYNHAIRTGARKIWIIRKSDEIYSILYSEKLKKKFGQLGTVIDLSNSGILTQSDLNQIDPFTPGEIIYTTYPFSSVRSLYQLYYKFRAGFESWKILVTQPWFEYHVFDEHRELFSKLPPVLAFSAWDTCSKRPIAKQFEAQFLKTYRQNFGYDIAHDYDVTKMILSCTQRYSSHQPKEALKKCFLEPRKFEGVSGAYLYDGHKSHNQRPLTLRLFDFKNMLYTGGGLCQ